MQPIVCVGVAGGTGSGKTTVADVIVQRIGAHRIAHLQHDAYYRDLSAADPQTIATHNFDHPDALESDLLARHLTLLKSGHAVDVPLYDFTRHVRTPFTRRVEPRRVILLEGILILAEPALRNLLDIKIFVDTDADIRIFRRIRRDMEQRGRTFESIRDQYYKTVRPMHQQFVEPSKRWADLIIPEGGNNRVALDLILAKLRTVV